MRDGKALQMGTSHDLGQNFAQAFDVWFLDRDGQRRQPWSTSWAVTTRLLGALALAHGDQKGLLLPPRVAPYQVVIVPISRAQDDLGTILTTAENIAAGLRRVGIRLHIDTREGVTPGFKFNDWEMRGVPLRFELGPRDLQRGQITYARRDTATKETLPLAQIEQATPALLENIQQGLYERAFQFREQHTFTIDKFADLTLLDTKPGFYFMNWCGELHCEERLAEYKATIRCIPLDEQLAAPTGLCAICSVPAQYRVAVAKAY
jgi:prolyl-tRNA synthetase